MKLWLSGLLLIALAEISHAHQAPSGWSYATSCCNTVDCREVGSAIIGETKDGYKIKTTGEVIPHNDKRIKDSPDGKFHWCSKMGRDDTETICLYRPPPSY